MENMIDNTSFMEIIKGLKGPGLIGKADENGVLIPIWFSDQFCKMLGMSSETMWEKINDNEYLTVPEVDVAIAKLFRYWTGKSEHAVFRMRNAEGRLLWLDVISSPYSIGDERYSYLSYTDITELKEQERRFTEDFQNALFGLRQMSGKYRAVSIANLTQNTILESYGEDSFTDHTITDYDKSIVAFSASVLPSDREKFLKAFDRKRLLKRAEMGHLTHTIEYTSLVDDGRIIFERGTAVMAKDSATGDVTALFTEENISDEVGGMFCINTLVPLRYEFIILVHDQHFQVMRSKENNKFNLKQFQNSSALYTSFLEQLRRRVVANSEYQRDEIVRSMSLETVRRELKIYGTYSVDLQVNINGETRYRRCDWFVMNWENEQFVMTDTDTTSMQREQLKRNKIISDANEELESQIGEIKALNEELEESYSDQEGQLAEIRALNEQLQIASQRAQEANKAKTSFLFNMSHDIRTPMNAIMGFRDLLEKHQEDPEKRAYYLHQIKESSKILLSIINNVLEMARIEKGTLEIDETATGITDFNDAMYSICYGMMESRNLEFTRKVEVQHPYVFADAIKLREIFLNLLSNACKYTNPGGKVEMNVEEVPSFREGWAVIRTTVSDTGIGMSEDFLPHLYDEFSREHSTTDNKIEGTGLGMPIVKRLVDMLDGNIEVKTKKGKGTTFTVTLPHRIASRTDVVVIDEENIDPEIFKGKRILIAEDNDINAEIAITILEEEGFVLERAVDGMECVDMLTKAEDDYYDLILMDIQMPRMNGYDATKAIRDMRNTSKANIPIIAMTANAFEEDKREALRCGMNSHVAKPIDIHILTKELAKAILIGQK